MGPDRVAQCRVWYAAEHGSLDDGHGLACFRAEGGETHDAVVGADQRLHVAARLRKRVCPQDHGHRHPGDAVGHVLLPPARLSRTTRQSSSPTCVNCGLPAHSPVAQTSGALVWSLSLTRMYPRESSSTPALAMSSPSVLGVRPVATRMSEASTVLSAAPARTRSTTPVPERPVTLSTSACNKPSTPSSVINSS